MQIDILTVYAVILNATYNVFLKGMEKLFVPT